MAKINNLKEGIKITKQAFSQARRKVSPKAFIHLLNEVNKWFYNDTPFNKYRGYRLLAIDGTVLQLHDSENIRNVFGYTENQNSKVARARASALYDIENDMRKFFCYTQDLQPCQCLFELQ